MRRCSISWPAAGSEPAWTVRRGRSLCEVVSGTTVDRIYFIPLFFIVGAVLKTPEQHHYRHRWHYFNVFFHECKKVICYSTNITVTSVQMELLTHCGYTNLTQEVCLMSCLLSSCADTINLRPWQAFLTNQTLNRLIPKIAVSPLLHSVLLFSVFSNHTEGVGGLWISCRWILLLM